MRLAALTIALALRILAALLADEPTGLAIAGSCSPGAHLSEEGKTQPSSARLPKDFSDGPRCIVPTEVADGEALFRLLSTVQEK